MNATSQQVPAILITGIDPQPMAGLTIAVQWDLPHSVVVHYEVNEGREVLVCTVSDQRGLIQRRDIDIADACLNCTIRSDLVATMERLAAQGLWGAVVAQLPVAADAAQICRAIGYDEQAAPHVRIAATVVALDGAAVTDDLLGDDLLIERELPIREDDERGVGETASALVEYADLVVAAGLTDSGSALLRTLMRPDAQLVSSSADVNVAALLVGLHVHDRSEDWVQVIRREPLPERGSSDIWQLDITSSRPFHPERLRQRIEDLGRGQRRSRGCFWLPSRPHQVCQWDGAGGMVSIGVADDWEQAEPLTRIVIVGADGGQDELANAFADCLLTDQELAERGRYWEVDSDGMEPWLGPVPYLMTQGA